MMRSSGRFARSDLAALRVPECVRADMKGGPREPEVDSEAGFSYVDLSTTHTSLMERGNMKKVLSVLVAGLVAVALVVAQETPAAKEKKEKMECCKEAKGAECCKEAKGEKAECCKEAKGEKAECCKEGKGMGCGGGCAMKAGEKMKHHTSGTKMQKAKTEAPKVAPKESK